MCLCLYFVSEGRQVKNSENRNQILSEVKQMFQKFHWEQTNSLLKAQAIIVLGGDGAMIDAATKFYGRHVPFYGLNFGSVGFLLNQYTMETIEEILTNPTLVPVKLLKISAYDEAGALIKNFFAINDVLIERASGQTVLLDVTIDGEVHWTKLRCDGVLFSSPVGSTAYNYQAKGPILPLKANVNILTPINGAEAERVVISADDIITITAENNKHRPARCYIDGRHIKGVMKVVISTSQVVVNLGFASSQDLHKKIKRLQFAQTKKI